MAWASAATVLVGAGAWRRGATVAGTSDGPGPDPAAAAAAGADPRAHTIAETIAIRRHTPASNI
jgi:hypothetical protein